MAPQAESGMTPEHVRILREEAKIRGHGDWHVHLNEAADFIEAALAPSEAPTNDWPPPCTKGGLHFFALDGATHCQCGQLIAAPSEANRPETNADDLALLERIIAEFQGVAEGMGAVNPEQAKRFADRASALRRIAQAATPPRTGDANG